MRISDWSSDVCSSDLRKLGDDEIFGYCRLIMLAGGGTTWRQLGITIYALLSNYEYWQACRDDRSLIDSAIHESLRWCPTDPIFPRLVTRDTEVAGRSEEHTSELQSLMRSSYAVFCLKKKKRTT